MAKFNEYTQKATPEDNDTLMIYDDTSKANKLSPFSGIWNWIVGKLTNAVIANLQTNNKTVVGALNELNSNSLIVNHGEYVIDAIESDAYDSRKITFPTSFKTTNYLVVANCGDGGYTGFAGIAEKDKKSCVINMRGLGKSTLTNRKVIWQAVGI